MYRRTACLLILTALPPVLCAAEPKKKTADPDDHTYLFCADSYGAIHVDAQPRNARLKLLQAPKGVELFPTVALLFWAPTPKQIGEHVIRLAVQPEKGKPREIAFRVRVKPLRRVLCVFAHPDDEFGIMARMKRLADRGVEVWGFWTCGGNPVRDAESVAAMKKLGLKKRHLIFQTQGDYISPNGLRTKIEDLANLLRRRPFDQIYTDAFEGGHTQHDMTHFIAVQAARLAGFEGQIYEFPLYNMNSGVPTMFTLKPAAMPTIEMTLSQAELDFIVSLVGCYPSQKMITQSFLFGLTPQQKIHPRYRPAPRWDYRRRTQPGPQLFEIKPDEQRPAFDDRIAGPVKAYFAQYGGDDKNTRWEQDRTPAEQTLVNKIYPDPWGTQPRRGDQNRSRHKQETESPAAAHEKRPNP